MPSWLILVAIVLIYFSCNLPTPLSLTTCALGQYIHINLAFTPTKQSACIVFAVIWNVAITKTGGRAKSSSAAYLDLKIRTQCVCQTSASINVQACLLQLLLCAHGYAWVGDHWTYYSIQSLGHLIYLMMYNRLLSFHHHVHAGYFLSLLTP